LSGFSALIYHSRQPFGRSLSTPIFHCGVNNRSSAKYSKKKCRFTIWTNPIMAVTFCLNNTCTPLDTRQLSLGTVLTPGAASRAHPHLGILTVSMRLRACSRRAAVTVHASMGKNFGSKVSNSVLLPCHSWKISISNTSHRIHVSFPSTTI
jgi:hypothetical protein